MLNKIFNRVVGIHTLVDAKKIGPVRVIDGDDIEQGGVHYRLDGYDAPGITNLRSQFNRELEYSRGQKAKHQLELLIANARTIHIDDLQKGLLRGRHLARLIIDGKDVADTAMQAGWGRPYRERKTTDWGDPKTPFPDDLPTSQPSTTRGQQSDWQNLPDGTVISCKPGELHVMDGDTVSIADGPLDGRAEFRVLGLSAPEVTHRKSANGRRANDLHVERGKMAAARLADLISTRTATLVLGRGDDGQTMHRSRRFAKLLLDGEDLADIACGEGWAARWIPHGHGPDWNSERTPFRVPE